MWTKQEGDVILHLLTGDLSPHTFWCGWNPLPGLDDHSRSWRQVTLLPPSAAAARQGHHQQQGCHLNTERMQDTTVHPREPGGTPGDVGWSDCQGEVGHPSQRGPGCGCIPCALSPMGWRLSHGSVGPGSAGLAGAAPCSKQVAVPLYPRSLSAPCVVYPRSTPAPLGRPLIVPGIVVAAEVKLWKCGINCLGALIIFSGAEIICQTQEPFQRWAAGAAKIPIFIILFLVSSFPEQTNSGIYILDTTRALFCRYYFSAMMYIDFDSMQDVPGLIDQFCLHIWAYLL